MFLFSNKLDFNQETRFTIVLYMFSVIILFAQYILLGHSVTQFSFLT